MQNAKDTFYTMLQGRIAVLNPARTVVIRGLTRPAVLVEENELPSASILTDTFRLEWTSITIDAAKPMPLVTLQCTIRYATDGTTGNAGMDRGRALATMDAELLTVLRTCPQTTPKLEFVDGAGLTPTTMATNIFWADPVFGPCEIAAERLSRSVTVPVLCYQEAGEL